MNEIWLNVSALALLWGSPIVALGIGVVYFVKARSTASLTHRLITSSFGPSAAMMFVAGTLWPDRYRYTPQGVEAFYWLQFAPFLLLVIALIKYPGDRRLHYSLVPIGLAAWAGTFAWAWLFIHGE